MRKEKGITLIALIITIIIMLILAGVVINLTIGENGLFKTAKQAAKNYTNAEAKELADLNNITNIVDQAINDETGGNGGTVPSAPETPTIDESILALKTGDFIKYDSGVNGEILCRVLYPLRSEYGLQIISDKNVKNVTLGSTTYSEAVESYNNAIETLNNEAEAYINTEYAYDARCVGSLPTIENGMFTKKDNGATSYVTVDFTNANYINSLDADTNYEVDKEQMEAEGVSLWNIGEKYWLASRLVENRGTYYSFCIRQVFSNGVFYADSLTGVFGDDRVSGYSAGVRITSLHLSENRYYKNYRWRWKECRYCICNRKVI